MAMTLPKAIFKALDFGAFHGLPLCPTMSLLTRHFTPNRADADVGRLRLSDPEWR